MSLAEVWDSATQASDKVSNEVDWAQVRPRAGFGEELLQRQTHRV
jgi:hypothetical protein